MVVTRAQLSQSQETSTDGDTPASQARPRFLELDHNAKVHEVGTPKRSSPRRKRSIASNFSFSNKVQNKNDDFDQEDVDLAAEDNNRGNESWRLFSIAEIDQIAADILSDSDDGTSEVKKNEIILNQESDSDSNNGSSDEAESQYLSAPEQYQENKQFETPMKVVDRPEIKSLIKKSGWLALTKTSSGDNQIAESNIISNNKIQNVNLINDLGQSLMKDFGLETTEKGQIRVQEEFKAKREKNKQNIIRETKEWGTMQVGEITKEMKEDFRVLQLRNWMDPKRFYRKNDETEIPKVFQVGTVVAGTFEGKAGSLKRKERKNRYVEEILGDKSIRKYMGKAYQEIQDAKPKLYNKKHKKGG